MSGLIKWMYSIAVFNLVFLTLLISISISKELDGAFERTQVEKGNAQLYICCDGIVTIGTGWISSWFWDVVSGAREIFSISVKMNPALWCKKYENFKSVEQDVVSFSSNDQINVWMGRLCQIQNQNTSTYLSTKIDHLWLEDPDIDREWMNWCGTEISVHTNHVFSATKHAREKKVPIWERQVSFMEQAKPNTFLSHS